MKTYHAVFICIFVYHLESVTSFNIDIDHNFLEYSISTKNTQFGYSISFINNTDTPLIVGAPSFDQYHGAIFKCERDKPTCSKVEFDSGIGGDDPVRTFHQRLGFSLSYVGKKLIACAPKFKSLHAGYISQPVGKCSVFDDDLNLAYNELPCGEKSLLIMNFGYCLAGTSVTGIPIKNEEPLYFVGTPGARHLRGHIFAIYADDGKNTWNPINSQEKIYDFKSNSYIGYSVSAGKIVGDPTSYGDVIGGAPRGYDMFGHVLLYNLDRHRKFLLKANITNPDDDRLGAYFGAAVCVADLNGDGKSDVLVGAPHYYEVQDEGRVYVYINKGDSLPDDWQYDGLQLYTYLKGDQKVRGKFGMTISDIGDINKDGFTDIAISAPGGDDGAVFIYNGGLSGIRQQYSQVIYASAIPGQPSGFGISVTSGFDVDSNSYDDLAIGAYLSEKVFVFKTRPIITLLAQQRTNVSSIPPDSKYSTCQWKNVKYYCLNLDLNLRYNTMGTPESFDAEITFDLDSGKDIRKRAFLLDRSTNKLVSKITTRKLLNKDVTNVITKIVYVAIRSDIDMLSPIKLYTTFEAHHSPQACGDKICGILNHYAPRHALSTVSYRTRCKNNAICKPDLIIDSSLAFHKNPGVHEIVYGEVDELLINSTITNIGEPAYQSKMSIAFNADLLVDRVEINEKSYPLWDVEEVSGNGKKLLIPITNPINENKSVNVIVKFSVFEKKPSVRTYSFLMEAKSIGHEVSPFDNYKTLAVGTRISTCVGVVGDASPSYIMSKLGPPQLPPNATMKNVGVPVEYKFYVKNDGRVPVEMLLAEITMVTEKDGVKLNCITSATVDDIPCQVDYKKLGCTNILQKPELYGVLEPSTADERSLNCNNAGCDTLRCNIRNIKLGGGASIRVGTRMLRANFAKVRKSYFETSVAVKFAGKDSDITDQQKGCETRKHVTVTAEVPIIESAESIPIWIIIAAAVGALFILALLILLLYKKKFFVRKKPVPQSDPDGEDEDDDDEEA